MTQGERVRMIRKHPNVNLTLEKFGEKLGIKKSALSLIENGKNNLTEQMAKSICREFRVNYFWLTKEKGEPFGSPFYLGGFSCARRNRPGPSGRRTPGSPSRCHPPADWG